MKKLIIIALVSATGIVAQASPIQTPVKKNGVTKSEVAETKTLPTGKAAAAAPAKATPSASKPAPKTNTSTTTVSKPTEKK